LPREAYIVPPSFAHNTSHRFAHHLPSLCPPTHTDSDAFFGMVTAKGAAMSLFATPDGRWHYEPAPQLVPRHTPHPAVGINRAVCRHHHHKTDWLAYTAIHSDAWLVALTFHNGAQARLTSVGRAVLSARINELSTLLEEFRSWKLPGGGGGRPAGTIEPPPPGPRLTCAEVNRTLRGRVAAIYHPEHDRWYTCTFTRVAPTAGTADIRLVWGGTSTVDLPALIARKHVVMIT